MYVIMRDDGAFVAPLGSSKHYTAKLHDARLFKSHIDADCHRIDGEYVLTFDQAFANVPQELEGVR